MIYTDASIDITERDKRGACYMRPDKPRLLRRFRQMDGGLLDIGM
jgi:hypothetical protein